MLRSWKGLGVGVGLVGCMVAKAGHPVSVMNGSKAWVTLAADSKVMQVNLCLKYLDSRTKTLKPYRVSPQTRYELAPGSMVTLDLANGDIAGSGEFQLIYEPGGGPFSRDEFTYQADGYTVGAGFGTFELYFRSLYSSLEGPLWAEQITPRSIVIFGKPAAGAAAGETKTGS